MNLPLYRQRSPQLRSTALQRSGCLLPRWRCRAFRSAVQCTAAGAIAQPRQQASLLQRALKWWDVGQTINDQERSASGAQPQPLSTLLSRIWALVSNERRLLGLSLMFMVRLIIMWLRLHQPRPAVSSTANARDVCMVWHHAHQQLWQRAWPRAGQL